jgi:pSer/pThr/pTyr-binding forkhead associated (FHA) protein
MVQLFILTGKQAGNQTIVRRFPFSVGRSPGNHLQLDEAGVWDKHLTLEWVDAVQLVVLAESGALVAVNQQPVVEAVLRNGDILSLGSVKLQFWLAPTRQGSLTLREAMVWGLLATVTAAQVALIYWLGCQ